MGNLQTIARKITIILFAQQGLASAAFVAASTLNAIVGAQLAGSARLAGAPSAVTLLAGALAAFGWGFVNEAVGRRSGLVIGLLLGAIGAGVAFMAIAGASFFGFLIGALLMGVSNAEVALARFAAADVSAPSARGRAISNVVVGGTVGSVLGPFMAGPAGQLFKPVAGDELAGAYAVGGVLLLVAALVVFLGLRPDPRDVGRRLVEESRAEEKAPSDESKAPNQVARPLGDILRLPGVAIALTAMIVGQLVMVLVMVITSLHMKDFHHVLTDISIVISAHTFGMYAFSVVSGQLVDRWGRGRVISAGATLLILACLAATISPEVLPLGVALFFLGMGWNFSYVGGSTLLSDQLLPAERARVQGLSDLLVGLASAVGSLSSGLIFAAFGYSLMAYISASVAILPLLLTLRWIRAQRRVVALVS